MITSSLRSKLVDIPDCPKLMRHEKINMICLMTKRNGSTSEGMVVWSGPETHLSWKGLPIGTYGVGWSYSDFNDYDGEVTLHTV